MSDAGTNGDSLHCHVRLSELDLLEKTKRHIASLEEQRMWDGYANDYTITVLKGLLATLLNASVSISGDEPEYAPRTCSVVQFGQLTAGDRFEAHGRLWTKTDCDVARKHSQASLMRGAKGYGYIGDSLCSFDPQDVVLFVAPNASNERQL